MQSAFLSHLWLYLFKVDKNFRGTHIFTDSCIILSSPLRSPSVFHSHAILLQHLSHCNVSSFPDILWSLRWCFLINFLLSIPCPSFLILLKRKKLLMFQGDVCQSPFSIAFLTYTCFWLFSLFLASSFSVKQPPFSFLTTSLQTFPSLLTFPSLVQVVCF